ncbi:hypothetical protein [Pseudomonas sp. W5-01]|uniref:hypothetical protein n=1 Tax=Pseudomonas sp. W5-01 TaxID=3097454 RepID=UPI00397C38FB
MSLEARGIEIRDDLIDIAARRQIARNHWSGHAVALHRIGLIDEEELREMLLHADAAYGHVAEE